MEAVTIHIWPPPEHLAFLGGDEDSTSETLPAAALLRLPWPRFPFFPFDKLIQSPRYILVPACDPSR
jgi:hypothetical protein